MQNLPLGFYGGKTLTHVLLDGGAIPSPAINAATATGAPPTDQRGALRIGNVDIGAFEVSSTYIAQLPDDKLQTVYNQTIAPESGSFVYTRSAGTLPLGLALLPASSPFTADNFAPTAGVVSIQGIPSVAGSFPFSIMLINGTNSTTINYSIFVPSAPTAASVSISGRVITPQDLGLTNASVTLTDSHGSQKTILTGKFGNFRFSEVTPGETYILSVSSKRYHYESQIVTPTENLTDIIFQVK